MRWGLSQVSEDVCEPVGTVGSCLFVRVSLLLHISVAGCLLALLGNRFGWICLDFSFFGLYSRDVAERVPIV